MVFLHLPHLDRRRRGDGAAYAAPQESCEGHAVSPPSQPAQICNGGTQVRPIPLVSYELGPRRGPGPRQGLGARSLVWLVVRDSTLFIITVIPVRC